MTPFDAWLGELEARHLADLHFSEVSKALRALSSTYVERRQRIGEGGALAGRGKRAAFALFYGPLHYLLIKDIVNALPAAVTPLPRSAALVDLGCGTGAAGAAWAMAFRHAPAIVGVDRHPWALQEAAWTYRHFALSARTKQADLTAAPLPPSPAAFLAAFTLNELTDVAREALLAQLLHRAARGARILIVEPLARAAAPWWSRWHQQFEQHGGRADEWRFPVHLPELVAKLDRAAGLNHRELKARSLLAGVSQ